METIYHIGLSSHMAGEHIFVSLTTARLPAAQKAARLSPERLPTNFALVLSSDMKPNPQNGKPTKIGTPVGPCLHFVMKTKSSARKGCGWSGPGFNDEAP